MKYKYLLARVYTYLAETALWEGEVEQAAHCVTQSLTYHIDPMRITIYEVMRLFVTARLATAQQQYLRAATLFGLADQAHSQVHYAIAGPIRALADAALETMRMALDPEIFAEAFATILVPSRVAVVDDGMIQGRGESTVTTSMAASP